MWMGIKQPSEIIWQENKKGGDEEWNERGGGGGGGGQRMQMSRECDDMKENQSQASTTAVED